MKRNVVFILALAAALTLTGCGGRQPTQPAASLAPGQSLRPAEDTQPYGPIVENIDFSAQYIRTNGYLDGEAYPKTVWISTAEELSDYDEQNKGKYDFGTANETDSFAGAIAQYDEPFFETHDLILVVLEEGSGSVRHTVTAVKAELSALDRLMYFIQPVIERQVPEVGTDDMAEWHIIIAVDKEHGRLHSELKDPIFQDKRQ